jgi:hypothetical protein
MTTAVSTVIAKTDEKVENESAQVCKDSYPFTTLL